MSYEPKDFDNTSLKKALINNDWCINKIVEYCNDEVDNDSLVIECEKKVEDGRPFECQLVVTMYLDGTDKSLKELVNQTDDIVADMKHFAMDSCGKCLIRNNQSCIATDENGTPDFDKIDVDKDFPIKFGFFMDEHDVEDCSLVDMANGMGCIRDEMEDLSRIFEKYYDHTLDEEYKDKLNPIGIYKNTTKQGRPYTVKIYEIKNDRVKCSIDFGQTPYDSAKFNSYASEPSDLWSEGTSVMYKFYGIINGKEQLVPLNRDNKEEYNKELVNACLDLRSYSGIVVPLKDVEFTKDFLYEHSEQGLINKIQNEIKDNKEFIDQFRHFYNTVNIDTIIGFNGANDKSDNVAASAFGFRFSKYLTAIGSNYEIGGTVKNPRTYMSECLVAKVEEKKDSMGELHIEKNIVGCVRTFERADGAASINFVDMDNNRLSNAVTLYPNGERREFESNLINSIENDTKENKKDVNLKDSVRAKAKNIDDNYVAPPKNGSSDDHEGR